MVDVQALYWVTCALPSQDLRRGVFLAGPSAPRPACGTSQVLYKYGKVTAPSKSSFPLQGHCLTQWAKFTAFWCGQGVYEEKHKGKV